MAYSLMRRVDGNADGDYDDAGTDDAWYHLTDAQHSTIALLDDTAGLYERISYDPYGRARHQWPADVDGDGDVDTTDSSRIASLASQDYQIDDAEYDVDADINRDGYIDQADTLFATTLAALAPGEIGKGTHNIVGYRGYIHNGETLDYTVRHRTYNTELGRWLQRDPAGYVDGPNMYEYAGAGPLSHVDPYGLSYWDDFWDGASGLFNGNDDMEAWTRANQRNRGIMAANDLRLFAEGKMTIEQVHANNAMQHQIEVDRINADIDVTQARVDFVLGVGTGLWGGGAKLGLKGLTGQTFKSALRGAVGLELVNASVDFCQGQHFDGALRVAGAASGPLVDRAAGAVMRRLSNLFSPWIDETAVPWLKNRAMPWLNRFGESARDALSSRLGRLRPAEWGGAPSSALTPKIGHTTPWSQMTAAQKKAFQHSYSRHAKELGLPNWSQKNAGALQKQFNDVVGYIRQHGTKLPGPIKKPWNGKSVEVNFFEAEFHGTRYYYYEDAATGAFISAGRSR